MDYGFNLLDDVSESLGQSLALPFEKTVAGLRTLQLELHGGQRP